MVLVFIAQTHMMSRGWAVWAEHENVQGETCLANYASAEERRDDDPINKAVTHLPPSSDMVQWSHGQYLVVQYSITPGECFQFLSILSPV